MAQYFRHPALAFAFTLGAAVTGLVCRHLIKRDPLSKVEETLARLVRDNIAMSVADPEDFGAQAVRDNAGHIITPNQRIPRRIRGTFIASLVRAAKAEFGTPTPIEANRMAVRRFVRDLMVERGVRPSHQMLHLDLVVAWVFVPSDQEIVGQRAMRSVAAKEQVSHLRYRGGFWRWVARYFGFFPLRPVIPLLGA